MTIPEAIEITRCSLVDVVLPSIAMVGVTVLAWTGVIGGSEALGVYYVGAGWAAGSLMTRRSPRVGGAT